MSNDALILELSAGLAPVRRRSVTREVAMLIGLGLTELALILGLGLMRPDMGQMIGSPYMFWKLGSLAVLAIISFVIAVRSFSPAFSPRKGLALVVVLAVAAIVTGLLIDPGPANQPTLLDRLSPVEGLLCAASIIVLSVPVMALLAVLMRRGAPTHPERSALASGLAAGTCGALIFAFCCRVNDPLYIVFWYFTACGAVTIAARWIMPRRFQL